MGFSLSNLFARENNEEENLRDYYPLVEAKKEKFEALLHTFLEEKESENKFNLARQCLNFALTHNTGYFVHPALEHYFCTVAQSLSLILSAQKLNLIQAEPSSFLHVLTTGYNSGVHTRLVERWIKNAPNNQKHSAVILNPLENVYLKTLNENINEKNGKLFSFRSSLDLKEKALQLRLLGMRFEYIILHIHMDDPTAVMAFGTNDFKRPVLFYNHSAHTFWIGKSICDLLLDLNENDQTYIQKRGIPNRFVLGVPGKKINIQKINKINREEKLKLREKLNLPLDKKIVLTSGGYFKYRPIGKDGFFNFVQPMLDSESLLYTIGLPENVPWKNENIIHLNAVENEEDYFHAADLYLDSFPVGGFLPLMDAIAAGTPALSLKSPMAQMDYFCKTTGFCLNKEEFIQKGKRILNDFDFAQTLLNDEQKYLIESQSPIFWNKRIEKLLTLAPKIHFVRPYEKDICVVDDLSVLNNVMFNERFTPPPRETFLKLRGEP